MLENATGLPLPDGWIYANLGEACDFERGVEPGSAYYNSEEVGSRFLRVVDLTETRNERIYVNKRTSKRAEKNDILMTFDGSPGIVKMGLDGVFSTGIRKVTFKDKKKSNRFLYYLLQSDLIQRIVNLHSSGSTIKHAGSAIPHLRCSIPQSHEEQQKIAEVISSIDELIEKTDRLIEKHKLIKQGLIQDLFHFGIDDNDQMRSETKHHFTDTQIGRFPEEWKITNFGDYITLLTDYHANGSYETLRKNVELLYESDYAVMIRTMNLENNNYKDLIFVNRKAYEFLRKSIVKPRDILMNKIANAGSVYLMPDLKNNVTLGMNLFLIRTNENELNQEFVFNYLKHNQDYVKSFAKGTTIKTITKNAVRNILVVKPRLDEQSRISSILLQAEKVITKEEANKQKLLALKHGLMDNLLSGKVRVNHLINQN